MGGQLKNYVGVVLAAGIVLYPTPEKHRLNSRWNVTATDGPGLVQGDPTTITWSYLPDGTNIPGFINEPASPSDLHAWLDGIYGNFATWHAHFESMFARWAELTRNTYVYEANDDGALFVDSLGELGVRGDVRIGGHFIDGNSGVLAYNFFPNNAGDMVLDSADAFFNNTGSNSLRLRNVLSQTRPPRRLPWAARILRVSLWSSVVSTMTATRISFPSTA